MKLPEIYKALRCNSKGIVCDYKADWRVDRKMLRLNCLNGVCKHFIHVANPTNTHMWFIHTENLDSTCRHLFGYSTPREIMKNVATLFSSNSFPSGVIQYFDGTTLCVISHDIAVSVLIKAALKKEIRNDAGCGM